MQYKLAIIIPTWNCSKYIREMLDSIISNTFMDWKCFFIDDQSTDDTRDIIRSYQQKDSRISLFYRNIEPKGAQVCRNIGFPQTNGAEYVMWMDADDVIAPYCFEQRVAFMDNHSDLDFGIFPAKRFSQTPLEYNYDIWGYDFMSDTLRCFLNRTLMLVGWTNIYRRQVIEQKKLKWDEKILSLQDADWNIQAICSGLKFEYASKENSRFDYFYRTVSNGITTKIKSEEHCASHLYHISKTLKTLSKSQQKKYEKDIRSCLVLFARIIHPYNKKIHLDFLNLDWFNSHKWLRTKFSFYLSSHRYSLWLLFWKEVLYHKIINFKWWQYKKKMYKESLRCKNN